MSKLSIIAFFLSLTTLAHAKLSPKWESLLKEIVEINSSTSNIEGLEKVRLRLIPEFEALGFKSKVEELNDGHKILFLSQSSSRPKIVLIGHIDTVFTKDSTFQKFTSTPQKFNGPGVNDMKGGIVMMLMVLDELKETGLLSSVAVLINDDEEIGSTYSAPTLKKLSEGILYGLVYEPTIASSEHVTTTQAGVEWLELKVKGQASHAGAEHEKGINACVELSRKITEIAKLNNYKNKFTVNPGVIQGGTKANVVCDEASVVMDVRYVNEEDLRNFRKKLDRIMAKDSSYNSILKRGSSASITQLVHIPSLPEQSTKDLFKLASEVAKSFGVSLKKEHMGGASDANQLAPTGMKLLGGMGPWGTGAHSTDEMMDIESFEKRKKISVELIKKLLSQ